ncbi:MAG: thioredoxin domain-containing protein [Rhodomicrobium sp.]|nr:MAG: thioredoxin domain-containing protein [Rhodomicrobium sp.]
MPVDNPDHENKLAEETSPYLLQHKDNPVAWWPWGEAALTAAREQNKPILISIGYAACHWCHVMAHESFEDKTTAALMNEKYINIKVDREERPDIDNIYMSALHHLGQQGGWPLTMFLTPEGKPYWGGTYFPPEPSFGRPSFGQALEYAEKLYREDNEAVEHNANSLTQLIAPQKPKMMGPEISDDILRNLAQRMGDMMDRRHGGLRGAPKFPQYPIFNFLWRVGLRFDQPTSKASVETLLRAVFQGGIYDHLAGGLARYSVDEYWLAPHFEKMLYDNALMMELAVNVYKDNKNPLLRTRVEEIVAWLKQEMMAEGGTFAASLDADSEGEEGKFYIWSAEEIKSLLGDDYEFFEAAYNVTETGNWEGKTILNRLKDPELKSPEDEARLKTCREKLLKTRGKRIRPDLDDKVLADWNGMMITSLTMAGECFNQPDWIEMAKTAYRFIQSNMNTTDGLHHSYRLGKISSPAVTSDYAQMIRASLTLYKVTSERAFIDQALTWLDHLNKEFWCTEYGGYFTTAASRSDVIIRGKSGADEATPNGNAVMVSNLMALHLITGDMDHREKAIKTVQCFGNMIAKNIFSHIGLITAGIDIINPIHLVILTADQEEEIAKQMKELASTVAAPGLVIEIISQSDSLPEGSPAKGMKRVDEKTTAYLCSGESCSPPITNQMALLPALKEAVQV